MSGSIKASLGSHLSDDTDTINVVTHSGIYHTDELLAIVILQLASKNPLNVIRTRNKDLLANAVEDSDVYVVDVGGEYDVAMNNFDHHMSNSPTYEGHKLSSAGLVWEVYGQRCIANRFGPDVDLRYANILFDLVKYHLINFIDEMDCGTYKNRDKSAIYLQDIVGMYYIDSDSESETFTHALDFMNGFFLRFFKKKVAEISSDQYVMKSVGHRKMRSILILDKYYYWQSLVAKYNADLVDEQDMILFVIYGDGDGGYKVQAVPNGDAGFKTHCSLPAEWRGLRDDALNEVSGLTTGIFVHPNGFIGGATSKSDAIRMAETGYSDHHR